MYFFLNTAVIQAKTMAAKRDIKLVSIAFLGGILFLVASQLGFGRAVDKFIEGVAFTFLKSKFKFTGSLVNFNFLGLNINIPKYLSIHLLCRISNQNPIGGTINPSILKLSYGNEGGVFLTNFNLPQFSLAANSVADNVDFSIDLELTSFPLQVVEVFKKIKNGEYRKLWISGTVSTSFAPIPVSQAVEISVE